MLSVWQHKPQTQPKLQQTLKPNYDGQYFKLADGTLVGLRNKSSSGGATIDINVPGQAQPFKIHIGGWSMANRTMKEELLLEGFYDWAYASWVTVSAGLSGIKQYPHLRTMSLGLIAEVLVEGLMVPGDVAEGKHYPWACSTGEAIVRITNEWLTEFPDEMPYPGAIVWLQNTEAGNEIAREVLAREASSS